MANSSPARPAHRDVTGLGEFQQALDLRVPGNRKPGASKMRLLDACDHDAPPHSFRLSGEDYLTYSEPTRSGAHPAWRTRIAAERWIAPQRSTKPLLGCRFL